MRFIFVNAQSFTDSYGFTSFTDAVTWRKAWCSFPMASPRSRALVA